MVWLYSSPPFDEKDKKLLKYLEKRTNKKTALNTVRMLSLHKFLVSHKFKSPKEIEESALYGKNKPVFTPSEAKSIFDLMKKRGGGTASTVLIDKAIRSIIVYIQSWLPNMITSPINGAYDYILFIKALKESPVYGPMVDIGKEAFTHFAKSAVIGTDVIAADIAGPVGAVAAEAVALPTTILVVASHIMDDEMGEAFVASFLAIPIAGPLLYTASQSVGKVAERVTTRHKDIVGSTRMFMGDEWANSVDGYIGYLEPSTTDSTPSLNHDTFQKDLPGEVKKTSTRRKKEFPSKGAKRFSTKRRKTLKWKRSVRQ
jgi:hypothetical protein